MVYKSNTERRIQALSLKGSSFVIFRWGPNLQNCMYIHANGTVWKVAIISSLRIIGKSTEISNGFVNFLTHNNEIMIYPTMHYMEYCCHHCDSWETFGQQAGSTTVKPLT